MTLNPFPRGMHFCIKSYPEASCASWAWTTWWICKKTSVCRAVNKKVRNGHTICANGIPWPSGPTQWSSSHSLHCWTEDKLCTWPQIIRPQMASCDGKKDPKNSIGKKKKKKSSTLKVKCSNCRWKGVYHKILIIELKQQQKQWPILHYKYQDGVLKPKSVEYWTLCTQQQQLFLCSRRGGSKC